MKEIIALAQFRRDKHSAEEALSKIVNDFVNKYPCEVSLAAEVVGTGGDAVGEAFTYQVFLTASF